MKKFHFFTPKLKVVLALTVFVFGTFSFSFAQGDNEEGGLAETLKQLSMVAAQEYVSPIVSPFGTNLNGGWFHKAPPPTKFSLNIEFGLVGMGTFFPDDAVKDFSVTGSFRFDSDQAQEIVANSGLGLLPDVEDALVEQITQMDFSVGINGPTIIGRTDEEIQVTFNGADITFADPNTGLPRTETVDPYEIGLGFGGLGEYLEEITFLPFLAPQIGVGTVFGTRAVFRYVPEIKIPLIEITKDIGKFSWFGWGFQHNPGVIFPTPLPLDVSLSFFNQKLKLEGAFEAKTTAFGLIVSKKLGIGPFNITPYAGYLIEKSKLKFAYNFVVNGDLFPVEFEFEGENKSRITVGLSLRIFMVNLNADYNIGNYNSVTFGLMFGL